MTNNDIKDYVNDICGILNIEAPKIFFNATKFKTATSLASLEPNCLKIKQTNNSYDLFFAIAHELRHKWQIETDQNYYFANYKDSSVLKVIQYNLQIAEIDANAFATIVMSDLFGIKPLFQGMPKEVISEIYKRADIIAKEWE